MNTIQRAINNLRAEIKREEWPEYHLLLDNFYARNSNHCELVVATCKAVGGDQSRAISSVAAIAGLHTSIVMIDDLLDNDERFDSMNLSQGDIANLSSAILAAGLNAVFQSGLDGAVQFQIVQQINQAVMATAAGQYWDTHSTLSTEADYWRNAQLKSGPFFGAAFAVGALAGGAPLQLADGYKNLGGLYGEMVQVNDDLHDCFLVPAARDWFSGQFTLPLLYASTVDHPEKQAFLELRSGVDDPQKLEQAQTILIRCGAVSYCIHCLMQYYERVKTLVAELSPVNPAPLQDVFGSLIAPALRVLNQHAAG